MTNFHRFPTWTTGRGIVHIYIFFTMNLFVLQHFLGHLGNPTTVITESFENSFMHKKIKYNTIIIITSNWCFYTNIYKEKNVCTKCQFTQECVLFFLVL